ncbi:chaperonin GroEL [Candidatus Vidania fulgoroideorum]
MKIKNFLYKKKDILKLIKGMKVVYKLVSSTFGPYGKNVIIEKDFCNPILTKDGYKVSNEISFKNKILNIGANILKESSKKTNEDVGDGTTTSIIITYNIIKKSFYYIKKGYDSIKIKKQILEISEIIIKRINKISKKIYSFNDLNKIASLSANNDSRIGLIISKTIKKVGIEGVIKINEGFNNKDLIKINKGFSFNEGFINEYFLSEQNKREIILKNPFILINLRKIKKLEKIIDLLENISRNKKPLLIITKEISKQVLDSLILNNLRKLINVIVVKLPYYLKERTKFIEDLSIFTNSFIFKNKNYFFKSKDIVKLGIVKKAIISKNKTVLFLKKKNKIYIKNRIKGLLKKIKKLDNEYEILKLKERISKFSKGIANIKVGGNTEMEICERKYRFEDSLNSSKAALEEGVVPGGGLCFLRISEWLKKNIIKKKKKIGYKIMMYCLKKPFKKNLKNSNINYKKILSVIKKKKINFGYDIKKKIFCNVFKKGIIDASKVLKSSFKNSISVSSLFISSKCIILTNKNIQDKIF